MPQELPPPAVSLSDVRRHFPIALGLRRREALRGVDLELPRGASLGLVGPNGSGKSTLMRLLSGVDRVSAGNLHVLGGSPRSGRIRARLAYLPEDSPFPRELSPLAALDLLGGLQGMSRSRIRARGGELLERVGLAPHAREPLGRFSRGMLRRFGLAQAFLHDPELILLDEPTAGLDAPGFDVLDSLVSQARRAGVTLVIASHVLADVHAHCDRMALLLAGRIAAFGTPDELLAVQGRVTFDVAGLGDAGLASLRSWVEAHGGQIAGTTPAGRSLLELYRAHRDSGSGEGV